MYAAEKRVDRFYVRGDSDQRTIFERDRDRLLHTASLQRLARVTQVVNPTEGRSYHNRLTHTLKVAQIARRIAENLIRQSPPELIEQLGGLNADVVEAAALAHDLGHPPFGHIGETQLNECVSRYNIDGYEGNAQSFRIITKLEIWREGVDGLNLSRATVNALIKYPWFRPTYNHPMEIRNKKWGAYHTEQIEFDWARELSNLYPEKYEGMALEAAIMDWADDIAYATHDMEDFYRAGLIPLRLLFLDNSINDSERERFLRSVIEWRKKDTEELDIRKVFEEFINFCSFEPYRGTRRQQLVLRSVVSTLIGRYVQNTKISVEASVNSQSPRLDIPPDIYLEVKILKDLTRYYVINRPSLSTQQFGEARVIYDLFNYYFEASSKTSQGRLVSPILPPDFQLLLDSEIRKNELLSEDAIRARVVADLISGLTDDEALYLHKRLSGINPGSFLDRIF
jgi:dGTPase